MLFKRKFFDLIKSETYSNVILFLLGIFIIIVGLALENTIIFSPDVSYLIYASNQLWEGGHYGKEIIETNPPMILYIYLPIIFLKKFLFSNLYAAFCWYVLMLGLISTGTVYLFLKKLIPQDRFYRNLVILTYLFVIFIVPSHAFGQREHIFLMVLFPYLISIALLLENKSLNPFSQFFLSVFAGLGFALKPFFIIPFVLTECYVIFYKKNILPAFRLNNIVIFSVFIFYIISIAIWQKGYFDIILPLVMKYYFPSFVMDWIRFFSQENVLFCCGMIISYLIFFKRDQYRNLGIVFCLGLLGTLIAYIVPKQLWYYHLYPALGLGFIVMMHCLKQLSISPFAFDPWSRAREIIIFMVMLQVAAFLPINNLVKVIFTTQHDKKDFGVQLQSFMNTTTGERSAFCFSVVTFGCFPMVIESNARYAESFSSFWWWNGLRKVEKEDPNNKTMIKDRKFLIERIADDLNQYQARWLVVNQSMFKVFEDKDFAIFDYFSQNEKFKDALKHYHYKQTVSYYTIYEREQS